jgi:hypothetical protein
MPAVTELQAGPEMDRAIVERLMAKEPPGPLVDFVRTEEGLKAVYPNYSTDIGAAWLVVEKMREQTHFINVEWTDSKWYCRIIWPPFGEWHQIANSADTAPLAICRAALAALEAG